MSEETKPTEQTQPTITAEQVAAYQQQQQAAELKAQEACMVEIIKVAERHGYMIVAVPVSAPGTGNVVVVGAQLGLHKK